jgi:hypothetical protein
MPVAGVTQGLGVGRPLVVAAAGLLAVGPRDREQQEEERCDEGGSEGEPSAAPRRDTGHMGGIALLPARD